MYKHNTLLLLLILLGFTPSLLAQGPPNGGPGGGRNMPAIGRVYGKVVDKKSKEQLEYVTITILNQRDSLIGGGLSQSNGDFSVSKLPIGKLKVRIQYMGYQTVTVPVALSFNTSEQDIGNIGLEVDAKQLKEVTISDQKPTVIMGVDRRIYNVDKDISARGGTAIDVMKNIPGLTVDADGNVSLRNNSPTIFIDGRPTTFTMEQLPADQIERVEVITNPSAKYDASASGGIVNVVMKKNNKPGYNGVIGGNIATNQFDGLDRYGLNGNINIKENKINFFASYNLNHSYNPTKGYTTRTSMLNGSEIGVYHQDNRTEQTRNFQTARLGFDYSLSNRNTLTLSQSIHKGGFDTYDNQSFSQTVVNNSLLNQGSRTNDQGNDMQNGTSQLMWKHTYPKQGKEWTADMNYNYGNNKSNSLFTTNTYDASGNPYYGYNPQLQRNLGSGQNNQLTFQFDYTNPVTDTARFEFGVKSNYKLSKSELNVDTFNNTSNEYAPNTYLTSHYDITDMTNAAYVNYTNMIWGLGYQVGLRFEQTRFYGELTNKNLSFEYNYPDGTKNLGKALFPSLFLSKKFNAFHEVQVNFSRKINRPGWMQIVPFIMFSDKNNMQIGNPSLAPEFTNLAEANYNYLFGFGNWLTSGYLRYQQNPITPYVYRDPGDPTILISTFINGDHNITSGWENTLKFTLVKKKLDLSLNANMFYSEIAASPNASTLSNEGFSWNGKAMASYKFPKQFTAQLNGSYEAPRIIAQGKTKAVQSIDFSLSKEVGKKLTINFNVNDIFNTRGFGSYYTTDVFVQDLWRRRDTRFFRVGFTYRFGEWDTSIFKRKNNKRPEGGGDQMEF